MQDYRKLKNILLVHLEQELNYIKIITLYMAK